MMKKWLLISTSLLLVAVQLLRADNGIESVPVVDPAEQRLIQLLNGSSTLSADFEQTVTDARGEVIQRSEGRMLIRRPSLLRWEVTKPNQQVIVSNGEKLWLYDLDLAQVTIQMLDTAITNTPAVLLTGQVSSIGDTYAVRREVRDDDRDIFYLHPHVEDGLFQELEMRFDDGLLRNLRLTDNLGQITVIRFRNVAFDMELDLAQFRIDIPDDVDVIDHTDN